MLQINELTILGWTLTPWSVKIVFVVFFTLTYPDFCLTCVDSVLSIILEVSVTLELTYRLSSGFGVVWTNEAFICFGPGVAYDGIIFKLIICAPPSSFIWVTSRTVSLCVCAYYPKATLSTLLLFSKFSIYLASPRSPSSESSSSMVICDSNSKSSSSWFSIFMMSPLRPVLPGVYNLATICRILKGNKILWNLLKSYSFSKFHLKV